MRRTVRLGLLVASVVLVATPVRAASSDEGEPPPDESEDVTGSVDGGDVDATPVTLPLIPVPIGCEAPLMPHVVFVGEVRDRDYRTARFEIESVRAGDPAPFAVGDEIDVRMGLDAQYLADGETYLVAAVVDPDLGLLVSRVTPPIEHFGGDEVIGVSESDVDCPEYEDPMRTLHVDGTAIDGSVVKPFLDSRVRIVGAFVVPFAIAVGVIFVLATFRLSLAGLYRSVTGRR